MRQSQNMIKRMVAMIFTLFGVMFLISSTANAATVYNCSADSKRCVAKLETGSVGDKVTVLDDKANRVGQGRIIKRKGSYGVISLTEVTQKIRRGFPVIINNDSRDSDLEWAATFSYKKD